MNKDLTCEQLHEIGAELALGVLSGRERAEAAAHLDRCADCREYIEQLALVGDGTAVPPARERTAGRVRKPGGAAADRDTGRT
ncbi:hypothetical protein [Streptomyces lydicus]|uniref:hypothetical protein n=1 Tax=Streptomyces lydicus TaxID=47763 RepID=UPI001F50AEA5|nr:hypothetical protein [Streptomyces lydicus]